MNEKLEKEITLHGLAIGLPEKSAENITKEAMKRVETRLAKRKTRFSEADLRRMAGEELEKYNKDLAFVLKNIDKIV